MDLSKRTIFNGSVLGFLGCVIASFAISNSQRFESGAMHSLLFATGNAFFFVPPIAIAFHVARMGQSQRPFLLGFLSGGLGGATFAILVTAVLFSGNLAMVVGSTAIVLVLSAVGALAGLLLVNRDGP